VEDVIGFAISIKSASLYPPRAPHPRDERADKMCKHIVLDFGSNIGDTAGKVIDAVCTVANEQI
jgi:hypothetical protein